MTSRAWNISPEVSDDYFYLLFFIMLSGRLSLIYFALLSLNLPLCRKEESVFSLDPYQSKMIFAKAFYWFIVGRPYVCLKAV
jgi:hypothetical protein